MKAVLFDVDGVLLDSDDEYARIYDQLSGLFHLQSPGEGFFRQRFGMPAEEIIAEAYGNMPEMVKAFKKMESEMTAKPMIGMEDMLRKISVKKGIVSTKAGKLIRKFLGDIVNQFDVIISGDNTNQHKPDPEPILLACSKLAIQSGDAIYIGDAMADYEMARSAGIKFIGFVSGGATEEEFLQAGVKSIVHSMKKLESTLSVLMQ